MTAVFDGNAEKREQPRALETLRVCA